MTIAPSHQMDELAKHLIAIAHAEDVARLRSPAEYERAVHRFFGPLRGAELIAAGDEAILGAVNRELEMQRHFAARRQTKHSWAEHLTALGIAKAAMERLAAARAESRPTMSPAEIIAASFGVLFTAALTVHSLWV
jgi:hypothetical protein